MKELIEKRFEKSRESFIKRGIDIFNNFTFLVLTRFTNDILKEIDEQESKPFDPCELGFEMNLSLIKLPNKIYSKNTEKGYFEIAYYGNNSFKLTGIIQFIKIPNHRQGVELLRNLGLLSDE